MPSNATPILLVVHDDNQLLRQIAKMTSEVVEMITSRRAAHANIILDQGGGIDCVLVGRCGDGVSAIDVLGAVRSKRPQARSILMAEPTDLSTPIEALHGGLVDHVINPPLREQELRAILSLSAPRPIINPAAVASIASMKRPV